MNSMSGSMMGRPKSKGLRGTYNCGESRIELEKKEVKRALVTIVLSVGRYGRWRGGIKFSKDVGEDARDTLLETIKIPTDNTNGVFTTSGRTKMG